MKQCAGIKPNGGRCERIVNTTHEEFCYSHDPERKDERKRNAARGGRVKATGEISRVKAQLQELADGTLTGEVDPRVAAVVSQIWNTYLAAVRTSLKVREIEDLERRIEELEALRDRGGMGLKGRINSLEKHSEGHYRRLRLPDGTHVRCTDKEMLEAVAACVRRREHWLLPHILKMYGYQGMVGLVKRLYEGRSASSKGAAPREV